MNPVIIKETAWKTGVYRETIQLRDAGSSDTWTGDNATSATFELLWRTSKTGPTVLDSSSSVSGTAADTVLVEVAGADFDPLSAPDTLYGVLYWTPSGGEKEVLAVITLDLMPQ